MINMKKYFVLCQGKKCHRFDQYREVFQALKNEADLNPEVVLCQEGECDGNCPDGPYLNIMPDAFAHLNMQAENVRSTIVNELSKPAPVGDDNPMVEEKISAREWSIIKSYWIIEEKCKGCTLCKKVCPAGAISGEARNVHIIEQSKCIKCGKCLAKCKFDAIQVLPRANGVSIMRCSRCGQIIGTAAHKEYVGRKLGNWVPEYELCVACRQASIARMLRNKG